MPCRVTYEIMRALSFRNIILNFCNFVPAELPKMDILNLEALFAPQQKYFHANSYL